MTAAEKIRREWAVAYGLPQNEIDERFIEIPPVNADEELRQLDAVKAIAAMPVRR